MTKPLPARPSPSQGRWDAPGSPSQPSAPLGAGMGRSGSHAAEHPAGVVPSLADGMGSRVRDLVWGWLEARRGSEFLYSDITKGLCGSDRAINRLTLSPRQAIREALHELAADGLISLSPAAHGRGGKPGTRIHVEVRTLEKGQP